MKSIPLTEPRLQAMRRDGDKALFQMGVAEIVAKIDGDAVIFFPDRSSAHRQLLASLGIDE